MNEPSRNGEGSKQPAGPKTGRILMGLIVGAASGVVVNVLWGGSTVLENAVRYGTEPVGQIWLRALIMTVIPLVFTSLSLGVAGMGDLKKLGRVGLKTLLYFLLFTTLAVGLGLVMVNTFRPGVGLSADVRERLLATYRQQATQSQVIAGQASFGIQTIVNIVPRNPLAAAAQGDMLGTIFFSLVFGVGLALLPAERSRVLLETVRGLGDVMVVIIDLIMKLAPYGVFALIFSVAARFGSDLLARLGWYVVTVIVGLAIFQFGMYGVTIRWLGGAAPVNSFVGRAP